jgi:hypothetical protein
LMRKRPLCALSALRNGLKINPGLTLQQNILNFN